MLFLFDSVPVPWGWTIANKLVFKKVSQLNQL